MIWEEIWFYSSKLSIWFNTSLSKVKWPMRPSSRGQYSSGRTSQLPARTCGNILPVFVWNGYNRSYLSEISQKGPQWRHALLIVNLRDTYLDFPTLALMHLIYHLTNQMQTDFICLWYSTLIGQATQRPWVWFEDLK